MALIPCHECGNSISDKAASCPKCGVKPKKKSIKPRPLHVFVLLALFVIVVLAMQDNNRQRAGTDSPDNSGEQRTASESRTLEAVTTAEELAGAYAMNEVRADQLFRGKWTQIDGVVRSINKDAFDNPHIIFDGGVVAQMGPTAPNLSALRPGMFISLRCVTTGLSLGMPYLRECVDAPH